MQSRDQFVKPPKTLKWYNMHCEKKDFSRSKVYTWTNEPARLNSTFPRIANRSLPSAPPPSRPVSQDTLRKWERAARDQSYMCNQAAAFSRCLTNVQDNMTSQLKLIPKCYVKGEICFKGHPSCRGTGLFSDFQSQHHTGNGPYHARPVRGSVCKCSQPDTCKTG